MKQTCQCSVRAGEGPADVLTEGGPALAPEVWPVWRYAPPWGPVGLRAPWGHRLFVSLAADVSAAGTGEEGFRGEWTGLRDVGVRGEWRERGESGRGE